MGCPEFTHLGIIDPAVPAKHRVRSFGYGCVAPVTPVLGSTFLPKIQIASGNDDLSAGTTKMALDLLDLTPDHLIPASAVNYSSPINLIEELGSAWLSQWNTGCAGLSLSLFSSQPWLPISDWDGDGEDASIESYENAKYWLCLGLDDSGRVCIGEKAERIHAVSPLLATMMMAVMSYVTDITNSIWVPELQYDLFENFLCCEEEDEEEKDDGSSLDGAITRASFDEVYPDWAYRPREILTEGAKNDFGVTHAVNAHRYFLETLVNEVFDGSTEDVTLCEDVRAKVISLMELLDRIGGLEDFIWVPSYFLMSPSLVGWKDTAFAQRLSDDYDHCITFNGSGGETDIVAVVPLSSADDLKGILQSLNPLFTLLQSLWEILSLLKE